jgi:ribonuclease R
VAKRSSKKPHKESPSALTPDRVLAHLAAHPGDTKRDLAKALGVRGDERQALKRILKELAGEGLLERSKKKSFLPPGALPEVAVIEITGTDTDGELIGRPAHWTREEAPPTVLVVPGREADVGPALGPGERVLARITRGDEGYEASIIKRLGASVHRVLGVLREGPGQTLRVEPIDRKTRIAFMIGPHDRKDAEAGELVIVEPLPDGRAHIPRGRVVERLGSMSEPKSVSLIAIHAHGIPTEFPHAALAEANGALHADANGRTDMRKIPLITIDPEDARDHDDAVWAGPDPDPNNKDGYVVLVAIADVAHYVTPGSALDVEARKRGNSVYFPDRVVPMLPERLSADLCSLRENEDRACLAVRMVFDKNGRKLSHRFQRGLMRSAARLTYREAQTSFDGKPDQRISAALHENVLMPLWQAYSALARARDARGPLDLDLPERRIVLGEDGKIHSINFRERLESMRLIEEFMIQANVAAAETLEKKKTPLLYRVHERPGAEKLLAFGDYLHSISWSFAKGQVIKPEVFNRILARAKDTPYHEVMNDVVLRTQMQAIYAPDNVGHFGLNLSHYAHFTSPIRRYADLVVHRALVRAHDFEIGNHHDGLNDREIAHLSETAEHISMCERRAMAAERDSVDRYVAAFMEDRIGAEFDARVASVTRFGLFVRLQETGADGLLPMRALGADFFRHDERRHALIGQRTGITFRMGDRLRVRLVEAAPLTGGLRFDLAEMPASGDKAGPKAAPKPGYPKKHAAHKESRKKKQPKA